MEPSFPISLGRENALSCINFFYINGGFLCRMLCLSASFVTVLLLGRAWSSGGRWLRVTLSLPGPCRADGHSTVAQLCLCRGPAWALWPKLSPCWLPALSLKGWERLEHPPGARTDSCYSEQCLQPPPAALTLLPVCPSQSVPEQSPSCSCSIPSLEGLSAWRKE